MDIRHFRVFLAIVDEDGLAAAGLRLRLGRATVTERLQTLEREVGGRLLVRAPLALTPLGKVFEPYARRIGGEVNAALRAVADIDDRADRTLRVGLLSGGAAELNVPLFAALRPSAKRWCRGLSRCPERPAPPVLGKCEHA